jgi:hypothetical protein
VGLGGRGAGASQSACSCGLLLPGIPAVGSAAPGAAPHTTCCPSTSPSSNLLLERTRPEPGTRAASEPQTNRNAAKRIPPHRALPVVPKSRSRSYGYGPAGLPPAGGQACVRLCGSLFSSTKVCGCAVPPHEPVRSPKGHPPHSRRPAARLNRAAPAGQCSAPRQRFMTTFTPPLENLSLLRRFSIRCPLKYTKIAGVSMGSYPEIVLASGVAGSH